MLRLYFIEITMTQSGGRPPPSPPFALRLGPSDAPPTASSSSVARRRSPALRAATDVLGSRVITNARMRASRAVRPAAARGPQQRRQRRVYGRTARSPSQGRRDINRYVYRPTFAAAGVGPTKFGQRRSRNSGCVLFQLAQIALSDLRKCSDRSDKSAKKNASHHSAVWPRP